MKVWYCYSSEHSSRMKIIGRFKTEESARMFEADFNKMKQLVKDNYDTCFTAPDEFPRLILDELFKGTVKHAQTLSPHDLLDFANDMSDYREGNCFTISSDEYNWAGVIKMMIEAGSKIEIFSEHDYPEKGDAR